VAALTTILLLKKLAHTTFKQMLSLPYVSYLYL
jgi:hypothetical protein